MLLFRAQRGSFAPVFASRNRRQNALLNAAKSFALVNIWANLLHCFNVARHSRQRAGGAERIAPF
jgi:hypothetical protein